MSKINIKYVLLVLVLGYAVATSCRKSWTCKCDTYDGGVEYVIIKKAKEDEAVEVCDSLVGYELNDEITRRCSITGKYKGSR
mgnify:CR=1 FL=1